MHVTLSNIGKRYNREWIFRKLDASFEPGVPTGIVGPNGSGKSTLLQCISGFLVPSEGALHYKLNGARVTEENIFRHVSMAAPYLDQEDWLTLREAVTIQSRFKPFRHGRSVPEIIALSGLEKSADKLIKQFSSGMKQRVRLTLAILAESELLLLDEPLSNLDKEGEKWFGDLLSIEGDQRTVIICSNRHPGELALTTRRIDLAKFKPNG